MEEYSGSDHEGRELKRGFYRRIHSERIYYFEGEYDDNGYPQIEKDGEIIEDPKIIKGLVGKLVRVNERKMEQVIERLEKRKVWIENCLVTDRVETLREEYERIKKEK